MQTDRNPAKKETSTMSTTREEIIERSAEAAAGIEALKQANAAAKKPRSTAKKCHACNTAPVSRKLDIRQLDLCEPCYDAAGMENSHSDGHHADNPDPNCPDCNPAAEPPSDTETAAKPKAKRTSTKAAPKPEASTLPPVVAAAKALMKEHGNRQPDFLKAVTVKLSTEELQAAIDDILKRHGALSAQHLCDVLTWSTEAAGKRVATSTTRVQAALDALTAKASK